MKKYILGFGVLALVFGVFNINFNLASAITTDSEEGCALGSPYNPYTGEKCVENTTPSGCRIGFKYSPITGMPCEMPVPTPIPPYGCMPVIPYGSKGVEVSALQQKLHEAGYFNGKVDGVYGAMTSDAVSRYKILYPCQEESNAVVITGVSGPQNLGVNENGTWKVSAYNKYGGTLSYSVVWGDEEYKMGAMGSIGARDQQTATFSHSYNKAGIYNPTFYVTSENTVRCIQAPCPSSAGSAKTSLSVNVGNVAGGKVTVMSPNGGETWAQGSTQTIRWQDYFDRATCPRDADECYVTPPAPKYYDVTIVGVEPSSGSVVFPGFYERTIATRIKGNSYKWAIPHCYPGKECSSNIQIPTGAYRVQVCQTDTKVCDSSDGYFKIVSGATTNSSITVLAPNGGETFTQGRENKISWSGGVNSVDIGLVREGAAQNTNIAGNPYQIVGWIKNNLKANSSGSIVWDAKKVCGGGDVCWDVSPGRYKIIALTEDKVGNKLLWDSIANKQGVWDLSDSYFKITPASTTTPSITVLAPNGGETWEKGSTRIINWSHVTCDSSGHCGDVRTGNYDISIRGSGLIAASASVPIATNVSGSSYSWPVGKFTNTTNYLSGSSLPDGNYIIQICQSGTSNCDSSNSYFKIVSGPVPTPSIKVVSPNGGTLKLDDLTTISLNSSGTSTITNPVIKLNLLGANGNVLGTFVQFFLNSNGPDYKWKVGQYYPSNGSLGLVSASPGAGYMIQAVLLDGNYNILYTANSAPFTLVSGATTQPLTLNAERHSASPYGYIGYGAERELFRFNLKPTGRDAVIKKLTFDVVGTAVPNVSNMKVYADGQQIGTLSGLKTTWSSMHYTADANVDWEIESDDSVEVSVRGDISSAAVSSYMWVNLTAIQLDSAITGAIILGLPVSGHQFNINTPTIPMGTGGVSTVLGAETFIFSQKMLKGSEGPEVRELQKALSSRGHYSGSIDGKFGVGTEQAVLKFQTANNLKVDGIVGAEVRAMLNK